jgi:hypothetical protein
MILISMRSPEWVKTRLMRRSKQQRHFHSFVGPPEAALGLLPLDPRPKQAILLPNTSSDWL